MAPFRAARSTRSGRPAGQTDQDIVDGLPIRQWRRQSTAVGLPPDEGVNESDASVDGVGQWMLLPMPKGSEQYTPWCQQLLRAARAGRIPIAAKRYRGIDKDDDDDAAPDSREKKAARQDDQKGFSIRKWAPLPRNLEEPEIEYLAKRRKGLTSAIASALLSEAMHGPMRRTKVRRVGAEGNVTIWDVLVPEGQTIEGEVESAVTLETAGTAIEHPAPGTIIEGIGIANSEGVLVATEGSFAPVRRRGPPPRRKGKKGPGRGRKLPKMTESAGLGVSASAEALQARRRLLNGEGGDSPASFANNTPAEVNTGEEDEEEGDGEDNDNDNDNDGEDEEGEEEDGDAEDGEIEESRNVVKRTSDQDAQKTKVDQPEETPKPVQTKVVEAISAETRPTEKNLAEVRSEETELVETANSADMMEGVEQTNKVPSPPSGAAPVFSASLDAPAAQQVEDEHISSPERPLAASRLTKPTIGPPALTVNGLTEDLKEVEDIRQASKPEFSAPAPAPPPIIIPAEIERPPSASSSSSYSPPPPRPPPLPMGETPAIVTPPAEDRFAYVPPAIEQIMPARHEVREEMPLQPPLLPSPLTPMVRSVEELKFAQAKPVEPVPVQDKPVNREPPAPAAVPQRIPPKDDEKSKDQHKPQGQKLREAGDKGPANATLGKEAPSKPAEPPKRKYVPIAPAPGT